ncbi:hypothetical protein BD289DRAFT_479042 [Coniella lustricola]|uniref:Protein kinase domain-containing protein n=1 Tax=Coniella lustricola TaxID=2025994 RepID=A0A2T3AKG1_9PEZI|nr:hypothetical protein BD289DRAFT_479042 [Coniella lustricola]
MAQVESGQLDLAAATGSQTTQQSLWRRLLGQGKGAPTDDTESTGNGHQKEEEDARPGLIRRVSRKVVPGLPRTQTFKRQQAEVRNNLEPVEPTQAERRAVSMDRRMHNSQVPTSLSSNPRSSAPEFDRNNLFSSTISAPSISGSLYEEKTLGGMGDLDLPKDMAEELPQPFEASAYDDTASLSTSQYDNLIHDELERIWILNLSMHFRDRSRREKFFVTYREKDSHWRRVTISLDYRGAPDGSLEMELSHTKFQREKSAKIYEAIRESLADIQFYDTVTNLKLQTTDGRLHVHVVEDINEIIAYPTARMVQHMRCRRVKESEITFEAHMSGFVYRIKVHGETLIKKEIPGPDSVDEFLYEINALSQLSSSHNVINFYGIIVDDQGEHVKGLLISYAEQGALIDVIFDHNRSLPWARREKWARQIVEGLSEIHEAGFVQGDFTLSNIVVDHNDNAKIIDINRRGCPVGWEPPEATPLIESNQRISMYIGVKSDLFQLGMVLWALAEQEDEPEAQGRPLILNEEAPIPHWYKAVVRLCLAENPQHRLSATELLRIFPQQDLGPDLPYAHRRSMSVDDGFAVQDFLIDEHQDGTIPVIKTVQAPSEWEYGNHYSHTTTDAASTYSDEPYYYPTRGRSPPSPLPSNLGSYEPRWAQQPTFWSQQRGPSPEKNVSPCAPRLEPGPGAANGHGCATSCDKIVPIMPAVAAQDDSKPIHDCSLSNRSANVEASEPPAEVAQDRTAQTIEAVEEPTGQPGDAEDTHVAVSPSGVEVDTQENMGTQDSYEPRSFGKGVRNFFSLPNDNSDSNTKQTQNSLFQEAGITEPAAPGTIALVPRAAKLQKPKSASTIVDTRQGWEAERVDSAVEMSSSSSISLPESWSGAKLTDDILCLGAGHELCGNGLTGNGAAAAAAIIEDDLWGA